MITDRWRDGKLGLVHQLVRVEKKETTAPIWRHGTVSSHYEPARERIDVSWLPLCGFRRKQYRRRGKHSQPLTCLQCIGRLS